MSKDKADKLERVKRRLAEAREQGAEVHIQHPDGEEVWHVKREGDETTWTPVRDEREQPDKKPGDAA